MKKFFKLFMAFAIIGMLASCTKPKPDNDSPSYADATVSLDIDRITWGEVTCTYHPTANCTSYHIFIAEAAGTFDQIISQFGFKDEAEAVAYLGVEVKSDTTFTWVNLTPDCDYTLYALVHCSHDTLISEVIRTEIRGGLGNSVINLTIDEIGSTTVTTTAIPNSQTNNFRDLIIEKNYFEEIGSDSVISLLKKDPYIHYTTDVWTWVDLSPSTEYFFVALGQNAKGVWGELSTAPFTTTGSKSSSPIVVLPKRKH